MYTYKLYVHTTYVHLYIHICVCMHVICVCYNLNLQVINYRMKINWAYELKVTFLYSKSIRHNAWHTTTDSTIMTITMTVRVYM